MAIRKDQMNQPATKGDVENAVDELAQITDKNFRRVDGDIAEVKTTVKAVQGTVEKTQETMKLLLNIVQQIDWDNKEFKKHDLPRRVARKEHDILKLKTKVG